MATYHHEEVLTLAFLTSGYAICVAQCYFDELPTDTLGIGAIELVSEGLIPIARTINEVWRRHFIETPFPGNWCYEVAEPMGRWVVDFIQSHQRLPVHEEVVEATLCHAHYTDAA